MTNSNNGADVTGILSCGVYIPRCRLQRSAIAGAVGWAVPSVRGLATGQRSACNWDEDSITMAVEAARDCLQGLARHSVANLVLASTTLPYSDRSNSSVVIDALNIPAETSNQDTGGSRRAATSALIQLLSSSPPESTTLLLAADCRETRPGSSQEMTYGHGAAALLVGRGEPVAVLLGSTSIHNDLVDQYRSSTETTFDYVLEERWVREEGYLKIVPGAVNRVLEQTGVAAGDIDYFIQPSSISTAKAVAKAIECNSAELVDPLAGQLGDCGVAHPLLMLCSVLEKAKPDQKILLTGFGQGTDVLLLKTTGAVMQDLVSGGIGKALQGGRSSDNYVRFLATRGQLQLDFGMRAERDNRTALSVFYRNREVITGFNGGRCKTCNVLQYPKTVVCVNCSEPNTQEPESLADLQGTVKSFTEDWLGYSPAPPLVYGNVTFQDGANVMMEFTDVDSGELEVGDTVRMVFRIKDIDEKRHFHRYFWKSTTIDNEAGKDG